MLDQENTNKDYQIFEVGITVELKSWEHLQIGSIMLTLLHFILDLSIGLWDPATANVSVVKQIFFVITVLTFGWWMFLFQDTSNKGNQQGLFVMTTILCFLVTSIIGLTACLLPCSGAFPLGDISHIGAILVGGASTYTTFKVLRENSETDRTGVMRIVISLVIIVIFLYFQGALFTQ